MTKTTLITTTARLLGTQASKLDVEHMEVIPIVPDGSTRRFFRLQAHNTPSLVAILPPTESVNGLDEAHSFAHIGKHLHQNAAPVPNILAFDPETGLLLCEDLGEQRLFEQVSQYGTDQSLAFYEQSVQELAKMQVRARQNFIPSWCWESSQYDRKVMLESESGYYIRAFCIDFLKLHFDKEAVYADCIHLAEQAAQAPATFFLHRDFQCRNIMICDASVRFIDFQGGRLGPLAYDLASLLLDPYAALPEAMQEELIDCYLRTLCNEITYNSKQFRHEYFLLSLQRNLQILGAFAFLSQKQGKPFFLTYLRPALDSLQSLLVRPEAAHYTALRTLTHQCQQELAKQL